MGEQEKDMGSFVAGRRLYVSWHINDRGFHLCLAEQEQQERFVDGHNG
jgi:hypothetical protein